MSKIRITWIKSGIGYPRDQRQTLRALGLHRLNQVVEKTDSMSIRGMLTKVGHLLKTEVVSDGTK